MSDETPNSFVKVPIFPTPPGVWSRACVRLTVPYHPDIWGAFAFWVTRLGFESVWAQENPSNMTPQETAQEFKKMWNEAEITTCMIGQIIPIVTETVPNWILPCDGATYQRDDYPLLYSAIHPVYRIDASSFSVPDYRGRTIVGAGQGSGLTERNIGDEFGAENVSLETRHLPPHDHSYTKASTLNIDVEGIGVPDPTSVGLPELPSTTGQTGSGDSHPNVQPSGVALWGIIAR